MANTIWCPELDTNEGPKYLALTRALRAAIRSGALEQGAQLPTVRDLAWNLKVTPGTVARAYSLATQEGLLAATVGRGTFVASSAPRLGPTQPLYIDRDPAKDSGSVNLRAPILPDVGQNKAVGRVFAELAAKAEIDWVDYPSQRGELPLREAVMNWIAADSLGGLSADDLVLTHGGQNAINLVFMCCLRGERPAVLTESLAYPGFRHAARLSRAETIGVDMDEDGILPDALEAACRKHQAQVLCVTPDAQNPTAGQMSLERRKQVVEVARRHDLQILEDNCYTLMNSNIPTLRALASERTWHVGSLSKTVSAGLRFGYLVAPTGMGNAGRLTAQHSFFALSRPVEAMVLELMESGEAARLRELVTQDLDERLQMAVNVLGAFDLSWQAGLRFVYLRLPSGWRSSAFVARAEVEGVLIRSADEFSLVHGHAPNAVRISLAGNIEKQDFAKALIRLAQLLARPPGELVV